MKLKKLDSDFYKQKLESNFHICNQRLMDLVCAIYKLSNFFRFVEGHNHLCKVQISFQKLHNIKREMLRSEASSNGIAVISPPRYHQIFLSLSFLVNFSGANCIQIFHSGKLLLSIQVLQKSLSSHFSLWLGHISFVLTFFLFLADSSLLFFFSELNSNDHYCVLRFAI